MLSFLFYFCFFFFFNDTATTEIYTLSLHDALPILAWMWPPDNTSICGDGGSIGGYCIQPGWLAFTDWQRNGWWWFPVDVAAFWIWNTSLFLPLLLVGQALVRWFPTGFPTWFAPMLLAHPIPP